MDNNCTVYLTMEYLSKRWSILILHELFKGEDGTEWKRFNEIKKSMKGITPKILSERLKELEEEELIEKHIDATSAPIKSEYRLTQAGVELMDIITDLKYWALKWKIDNPPCGGQNCKLCRL